MTRRLTLRARMALLVGAAVAADGSLFLSSRTGYRVARQSEQASGT